jgi:hypothetical protein
MIAFLKKRWLIILMIIAAYFLFFKKATQKATSSTDMSGLIGNAIGQRGELTAKQNIQKTQMVAIGNQMRAQGKSDTEIIAYVKANWISQ